MNLARTYTSDSVVLVGSGRSALDFQSADFSRYILVVMNNAWKLFPETYDIAIYAGDMNALNKPIKHEHQVHVSHYIGPRQDTKPISQKQETGYGRCLKEVEESEGIKIPLTSMMAAGYWCIWYLKPKRIGFIGCDLDYTPDKNGHTHFYGIGHDIVKRKKPDPFLRHSKEEIILALHDMEKYAMKSNCELVNYSENPNSLLPFRREKFV